MHTPMKRALAFALTLVVGFVPILFLSSRADAVPIGTFFKKHGAKGGHYCPFNGCCCWNNLALDPVSADDFAAGFGTMDITVTSSTTVHLVFDRDPELTPSCVGGPNEGAPCAAASECPGGSCLANYLQIADNVPLGCEVSQALGYAGVTMLPGAYEVDFAIEPFGEVTVNATTSTGVGSSKCDFLITKLVGKKIACKLNIYAKAQRALVAPDSTKLAKCEAKFSALCTKAKAAGDCSAQSLSCGEIETQADAALCTVTHSP